MRLVSHENDSFENDPLIQRFLPYSSHAYTEILPNASRLPPKAFKSTQMTSQCRNDPEGNEYQRVFRKLGRKLYNIQEPPEGMTLYPSDSFEEWACNVFTALNGLLAFDPNILVTRNQILAVVPDDNPAYGAMYLSLMAMRNNLRDKSAPDIPVWPRSNCIFTEDAFEVAAVVYRDEVERFITWVYARSLEQAAETPARSPVSEHGSQHILLQELRDATNLLS